MFNNWLEYEKKYLGKEHPVGWEHSNFAPIKRLINEEREFITQSVQIEEGEACVKCGGKRTYTYQKQVRSADEGFTSFTICFDCNYQLVE